MSKPPIGVRTITGSPPTITFPLLLAGSVGALLIYAAIKGQSPVDIVKTAIGQQKPAKLAPGTNITPMKTGQASWGTKSGHSIDPTYVPPANPYAPPG